MPIVFWHALGPVTTGEYAAELAGPLVARDAHVIAPDGPGHGASPPLPRTGYRTRALAQMLDALLDDLGVERAVLIGHSWGAMVAAHFAAARTERVSAVVLLDAGYGDPRDQPGVERLAYPERVEQARAADETWRWDDWDAFDADARDGLQRWTPELGAIFRAGLREDGHGLVARVAPEARAAIQDELYRGSITSTWRALARLPVLLLVAGEPPELEPYRAEAVERFRSALACRGRPPDRRRRPRPCRRPRPGAGRPRSPNGSHARGCSRRRAMAGQDNRGQTRVRQLA